MKLHRKTYYIEFRLDIIQLKGDSNQIGFNCTSCVLMFLFLNHIILSCSLFEN
jgi:hypothetical protein